MRHYLLDENKNPYQVSLEESYKIYEDPKTKLVKQNHIQGVYISTVFLGLDHSFSEEGPPVLFETMIFGGEHDQFQTRYTTYKDALEGHEKAMDMVRNNFPNLKI